MPDTLQATSSRFISLNTDFGYDALGGVGQLGTHRMEVLTPGTRRTDGISSRRFRTGSANARE